MKKLSLALILMHAVYLNAQQVVLEEYFESGIPNTWTVIDGDGYTVHPSVSNFQAAWIGLTDPFNPNNNIAGSTSYFEPENQAYRFLITPQIALGAYGNILSWSSMSHDPSFPDWIMVLISTTGTEIEDFTDTLFRLNNEFPYWTSRSINLSDSGYVDQNVYLAFVNHTNRGFKLYVDSVQVEVNNPANTPNASISSVRMFPNPANEILNFYSTETIQTLEIIDVSGKRLYFQESPESSIDVSQLQPGIYYLRFMVGDSVESKIFQKL